MIRVSILVRRQLLFQSGKGTYTVEFEPSATILEQEGVGYVVASLGTDSGYVPYTAYCAKTGYLEAHPEVIQGFVNALQKGMDYVNAHTPEEIAEVIRPQFKETDLKTITAIVTRYYEQNTWKEDLVFEQESFRAAAGYSAGGGRTGGACAV